MELKDVKLILKRIQSYYSSFIIDDFKTKEWYNELKKFDYDDVNKKLEEHMRSADYGTYEPKLFYLTKYLKTKEEKEAKTDYYCSCTICGKYFKLLFYLQMVPQHSDLASVQLEEPNGMLVLKRIQPVHLITHIESLLVLVQVIILPIPQACLVLDKTFDI